jgi:hypothetical protein
MNNKKDMSKSSTTTTITTSNDQAIKTNFEEWVEMDKLINPNQTVEELRMRLYHKHKMCLVLSEKLEAQKAYNAWKGDLSDEIQLNKQKDLFELLERSKGGTVKRNQNNPPATPEDILAMVSSSQLTLFNTREEYMDRLKANKHQRDQNYQDYVKHECTASLFASVDEDYTATGEDWDSPVDYFYHPDCETTDNNNSATTEESRITADTHPSTDEHITKQQCKRKFHESFDINHMNQSIAKKRRTGDLHHVQLPPDFAGARYSSPVSLYVDFRDSVTIREIAKAKSKSKR